MKKKFITALTIGVLSISSLASAQQIKKPYINGYPDGSFRPDSTISRAETAKMLADVLSIEFFLEPTFKDVPQSHWAFGYIGAMQKINVMRGYFDNTFIPDAGTTRAELATTLARLLPETAEFADPFPDTLGHWAQKDISKLSAHGIISGTPEGLFHPDAFVSRAEAVKMINGAILGVLTVDEPMPGVFNDIDGHWAQEHIDFASYID